MKMTLILALLILLILTSAAFAQDASKIQDFAHAIAKAEGFYVRGSVPSRYHNPGDIRTFKKGVHYSGQVGVNKQNYVIFKNDAAGWAALYSQIEKALNGESRFYNADTTFRHLARTYATGWRTWLKNVTHELGNISPDMTLGEFFELPPVIHMNPALNYTFVLLPNDTHAVKNQLEGTL